MTSLRVYCGHWLPGYLSATLTPCIHTRLILPPLYQLFYPLLDRGSGTMSLRASYPRKSQLSEQLLSSIFMTHSLGRNLPCRVQPYAACMVRPGASGGSSSLWGPWQLCKPPHQEPRTWLWLQPVSWQKAHRRTSWEALLCCAETEKVSSCCAWPGWAVDN